MEWLELIVRTESERKEKTFLGSKSESRRKQE
jgi:hypothetical protein